MTGAYVRIERNGKWQPIEIDELTDIELEWFSAQLPNDGWKWAKFLAAWIRDNVHTEPDLPKEAIEVPPATIEAVKAAVTA